MYLKLFISEQIAENWFGDLLEISEKFISSHFMIWSLGLKQYENFKTILYDFKTVVW